MNFLKRHKTLIIIISILIILAFSIYSKSAASESYESVNFEYGKVTASSLNIRKGPGINYPAIGLLKSGEYIRVFAKIGNWYVIQAENNLIGAVYSSYVEPYTDYTEEPMQEESKLNNSETSKLLSSSTDTQTNALAYLENEIDSFTDDEKEFISLINSERQKNNLPPFQIDSEVQNVARLKANDLVKNNYFSHTSPVYGSLFDMLSQNGVSYKNASENIAGNSNISGAIAALMNSETHKNNILSTEYKYTGVGVANSPTYGKILVQIFTTK